MHTVVDRKPNLRRKKKDAKWFETPAVNTGSQGDDRRCLSTGARLKK